MSVAANFFGSPGLIMAGAAVAVILIYFVKRFANQAERERFGEWLWKLLRIKKKKPVRGQPKSEDISTDQDVGATQRNYLDCGRVFHRQCIEILE